MVLDKLDKIGCATNYVFDVEIKPNSKPVVHKVRNTSRLKEKFIDEQIDSMLSMDVIEPCLTEYQSGVVVVPKPGVGDDFRFCVDLRDLND